MLNPVEKMLGTSKNIGWKPKQDRYNTFKTNSKDVVSRIQQILNEFPDVKNVQGNLKIRYENGGLTTIKLDYNEK